MARVLLAFHNHLLYRFSEIEKKSVKNAFPPFFENFIKGLQEAGNELLVYNCGSALFWNKDLPENCPKDIKKQIQDFDPELAILFNNEFYDITDLVSCPIVVYEVDSPMYYSNKTLLGQKPNRFKYCTSQTKSIEMIQQMFGANLKNIQLFPFFSMVKAEKVPFEQNICFIGTKLTPNGMSPMNVFMNSNPTKEEIALYKVAINEVLQNPFITNEEIISKHNIESPLVIKNMLSFVEYISSYKRIKVLSSVADLGLVVYGSKNWASDLADDPFLTLCYNNKLVHTLKDNQEIYNKSKIGININHHQAVDGFSWRVSDIMASNACLVTEYKKDLDLLFPKIPIPTFDDVYQARDICKDLLNNENKRLDIVAQCNDIIKTKYRFKNILEQLENFVNLKLQFEKSKSELKIIEISCNTCEQPILMTPKKSKKSKIFDNLRLKNRFKIFFYSLLLAVAQVPIIDLFCRPTKRQKLLQKIRKWWR